MSLLHAHHLLTLWYNCRSVIPSMTITCMVMMSPMVNSMQEKGFLKEYLLPWVLIKDCGCNRAPTLCDILCTLAVFTWARITFRKTFRIAIQNVIGTVIWTTCINMHCKRLPITIRICALRGNILLLLRSPCALIDPCAYAWLQRTFIKCTRTNHVQKELCVHMS